MVQSYKVIIFINTLGHEIEKDNRVSAWRTFG